MTPIVTRAHREAITGGDLPRVLAYLRPRAVPGPPVVVTVRIPPIVAALARRGEWADL